MKITEAELAAALNAMILPGSDVSVVDMPVVPEDAVHSTWPAARSIIVIGGTNIAAQVFQAVRDLRAEAGRRVTGALYQCETGGVLLTGPEAGQKTVVVSVYRHEKNGWSAYDCGERFPDGRLDTAGFRRLIPESTP